MFPETFLIQIRKRHQKMVEEKEVQKEIFELMTLMALTSAYAEVASLRMKRVRSFVLKNRDFLSAIDGIFQEVLATYKKQVEKLANKKGEEGITFLAHNGKTVSVLLSANAGLYGDIVHKTFDLFSKSVKDDEREVVIIGRLGLSMFETVYPNTPYTYFDSPDKDVGAEVVQQIISHLVAYERIHVYYGKFQSVVSQEPAMYDISADPTSRGSANFQTLEKTLYFFEPNLSEILSFFESQIFASLFDQTLRESQLAKFGSRIQAMSKANENVNINLKRTRLKKLKLSHNVANRRQLNSLSRLMHWSR